MRGISWLAANRLASQEGLCSMEWVSARISSYITVQYYPRFHITAVGLGTYYPRIRGHYCIHISIRRDAVFYQLKLRAWKNKRIEISYQFIIRPQTVSVQSYQTTPCHVSEVTNILSDCCGDPRSYSPLLLFSGSSLRIKWRFKWPLSYLCASVCF
jgi:hypothetical protein